MQAASSTISGARLSARPFGASSRQPSTSARRAQVRARECACAATLTLHNNDRATQNAMPMSPPPCNQEGSTAAAAAAAAAHPLPASGRLLRSRCWCAPTRC